MADKKSEKMCGQSVQIDLDMHYLRLSNTRAVSAHLII